MNLIERVTEVMETDYDNMDKQSALLLELYDRADDAGKQLLDQAFVCLCGWSLKSLRAMADTEGSEDDG